jgi:hypothetical protein
MYSLLVWKHWVNIHAKVIEAECVMCIEEIVVQLADIQKYLQHKDVEVQAAAVQLIGAIGGNSGESDCWMISCWSGAQHHWH